MLWRYMTLRRKCARCEYCDDDFLMAVSQRHEADSLDSTLFSEYEEESANVSEKTVPEHQNDHEIECWNVSSEYDEEFASKNNFLHATRLVVDHVPCQHRGAGKLWA